MKTSAHPCILRTMTIRDNVKKYYHDTLLCVYVIEHQQNIDYHMVIRNMLSHIHLFDYHNYDNFDMFHTELRQVFSFLKNATNRGTLRKLIAENPEEYYNISTDTYELINTITNTSGLLSAMQLPDNTNGGTNMWRAFEELIEEGRMEGREDGIRIGQEDGIRALVLDYSEEGFSRAKILNKLQRRFSLSSEQAEIYFEKFSSAASPQ